MKAILRTLVDGRSLSRTEASQAMNMILKGGANNEEIAAFLGALSVKKESVPEIVGFSEALRACGKPVEIHSPEAIDTCGTGGDGAQTFNISTTVAFVAAGAGAHVAKHGNRSVSSRSGSADVLESLGVAIELPTEKSVEAVDSLGFGFFYAPQYLPALSRVAQVRKALGVRTVFNLMGPIVNPAGVRRQVMGVYDPSLTVKVAEVLRELGSLEAMVICGDGGMDEFSLSGPTQVAHLKHTQIKTFELTPEETGLKRAHSETLRGGDANENAQTVLRILRGETGPKRDVTLLNAAAALIVAGRAGDWREGMTLAARSIDEGAAMAVLEKLRALA